MSITTKLSVLAAAALCAAPIFAKAPASAPAGTTAMCKDGSFSSAATKSGACSGHDGVKKWYGAATESAATGEGSSSAKSSKSKHGKESSDSQSPTAASPATAAAATGTCKDGTTTTAASKSGACSGHGGVKQWNAAPSSPVPSTAPAAKSAPAVAAAPSKVGYAPPAVAAPGGGNGQVWVNKDTKVYHCPGDKWYGKTKEGAYMSESGAVAQGYHADHGKACQQ